jgi:hypothetical protein
MAVSRILAVSNRRSFWRGRAPRRVVAVVVLATGLTGAAALAGGQAAVSSPGTRPTAVQARGTLPARLTDAEFWRLSQDLSEPDGFFRSENLVSNEHTFQYVIPALKRQVPAGGAYLGVAPDQNFTYIVATEPAIAFIVDIRRGNLLQHLLYKALFEISRDRAELVSRLFSKPRPPGLGAGTSVEALFAAFAAVETDKALYTANVEAVRRRIMTTHRFGLSQDDWEQLESIYFAFFWDGPSIRYSPLPAYGGRGSGNFPSYEELMRQTDWEGTPRGYLASEANFRFVKGLQERNLIVPVVGNFAGPKALRGVGQYLRQHGATVSAFYVSNVEQYLMMDFQFPAFARNVATLPLDGSSTFIRSVSTRFGFPGSQLGPDGRASALDPIRLFVRDFEAGRIRTYQDVNVRSR